MLKPEQVPDEAVFAMQDCMKDPDTSPWDWLLAAINAWPGAFLYPMNKTRLILPLPQESGDDHHD